MVDNPSALSFLNLRALQGNGADKYIDWGPADDLDLDADTPFSIGAWVKDWTAQDMIWSKDASDTGPGTRCNISDANNRFDIQVRDSNGINLDTDVEFGTITNPDVNGWRLIIMSYAGDRTTLTCYCNGLDESNVKSVGPLTGNLFNDKPLTFMKQVGKHWFAGKMDEIFICNGHAVTPAEALAIWEGRGTPGTAGDLKAILPPGAITRWGRCGEGVMLPVMFDSSKEGSELPCYS